MMSNNAFKPMPLRGALNFGVRRQEQRCILDTSFSFLLSIFFIPEIFAQDKILDRPEWKEFFDKHEATGTILIVDSRASAEKVSVYDRTRWEALFSSFHVQSSAYSFCFRCRE